MGSFNIIDLIIVLCFIPALIGGVRRGFIRQVAALIALIVGVWGGIHFSSVVSEFISRWTVTTNLLINIVSFTVIFIVIVVAITLVGKVAEGVVKIVLMGGLNRILGVIFAVLKYAFTFSIIIHIVSSLDNLYDFLPHKLLEDSVVYPYLRQLALTIFPHIEKLW